MATTDYTRKVQPDGLDLRYYRGHERWTPEHWAWQFLRRNHEFIARCKAVQAADEAAKLEVAKQFGLRKFKDYREPYAGGSGRAKFASATPARWAHIVAADAPERRLVLRLQPGQVLVRFDVLAATDFHNALDKQLRNAGNALEKHLVEARKLLGKHRPGHSTAHSTHFLRHIRFLDLVAKRRHTQIEALRLLDGSRDPKSWDNLKHIAEQAKRYAMTDYLVVAHMEGRTAKRK